MKKTTLNYLPLNVIKLVILKIKNELISLINYKKKQSKAKHELYEHFKNDYSQSDSLHAFEAIKMRSECLFAKRAELWGSQLWNENLTIQDNVKK